MILPSGLLRPMDKKDSFNPDDRRFLMSQGADIAVIATGAISIGATSISSSPQSSANAMINAPSLLLADEPTGALDRENVEKMADLLLELNQKDGLTLMVVTHSLDLAKRMGKTLEFKNGTLEQI